MTRPKLIFFDAAGTLITVRGNLGELYAQMARRYGVTAEPANLQQRFQQSFRAQPPLAFPNWRTEAELKQLEYAWWRGLVRAVFADYEFARFDEFFAALFEHFRHAQAWCLYDDVVPALSALRQCGIHLAVLSNFDTRLNDLLKALELEAFFDAVHLSSRLGAAKPDAHIFELALQAHGLPASEVWHVGDSVVEDVEGAHNVGIAGWLIRRDGNQADGVLTHLGQLVEMSVSYLFK